MYPNVAYSPLHDEYLVIWSGFHKRIEGENRRRDIFGQRFDGTTGEKLGEDHFQIGFTSPEADTSYRGASLVAGVAYNSVNDEYLVAWSSDDDRPGLIAREYEVYVQRIEAGTGAAIGNNALISDMGGYGNLIGSASSVRVGYSPNLNRYLVVWGGSEANNDSEMFGQFLVGATATQTGINDFAISSMGPPGNSSYGAFPGDLAYNPSTSEFLVVWSGADDSGALVAGEFEIWGRRVSAATLSTIGGDLRLTTSGVDGDLTIDAFNPDIAYNAGSNEFLLTYDVNDLSAGKERILARRLDASASPLNTTAITDTSREVAHAHVVAHPTNGQYLVTWREDVSPYTAPSEEYELFGQRLSFTGSQLGSSFQFTEVGDPGNGRHNVSTHDISASPTTGEFVGVYSGTEFPSLDIGTDDTIDNNEIFAQFLTAGGTETGEDDFPLSGMGEHCFDAFDPAVATDPTRGHTLIVWSGDGEPDTTQVNEYETADDEFEIFSQLVDETGAPLGPAQRLSFTGPEGDDTHDATDPAVAYCETSDLYLVVWSADPGSGGGGLAPGETEIFGRLVEADTGVPAGGSEVRYSDMGPDGAANYLADRPAVAASPSGFLVVWRGDDNTAPLVDNEFEAFGQRVSPTGAELGGDFRLSDMGPNGNTSRRVETTPDVAYCAQHDEYLVVFAGSDLTSFEFEIYGQRIDPVTGAEIGTNDFRLSDMGPDGVSLYGGTSPAVAYSDLADEYLVVWSGDDDTGALVNGELEIFGQRVRGGTSTEVGPNDFRISFSGPDGDPDYDAFSVDVAWEEVSQSYLVAWDGEDDSAPHVDGKVEIFIQPLDSAGLAIGPNLPFSCMGPPSHVDYDAFEPAVTAVDASLLLIWSGDDRGADRFDGEFEIFGEFYDTTTVDAPTVSSAARFHWLEPTFPNPAGNEISFRTQLPVGTTVEARLVDVTGRVLRRLPPRVIAATGEAFTLPTDRIPTGVYFLEVRRGDAVGSVGTRVSRKVTIVR